jgi:hypothetical protein
MMCHLLGWNLDFKTLLVMYHLTPVSSRDGTDLNGNMDFMQTVGLLTRLHQNHLAAKLKALNHLALEASERWLHDISNVYSWTFIASMNQKI